MAKAAEVSVSVASVAFCLKRYRSHSRSIASRTNALRRRDTEVVRALVRAGADVNACSGERGRQRFICEARRGHTQIARALLDSGAALNARDSKGDVPLQRTINW